MTRKRGKALWHEGGAAPYATLVGKTWGAREVVGTVVAARLPLVIREAVKDMADQFSTRTSPRTHREEAAMGEMTSMSPR